jgi:hypothetical protein
MPPPQASDYEEGELDGKGTYGIMALVRNPSADTLGEASQLTGISTEKLKTDRRSNIFGGAALLARSQGERPTALGDYWARLTAKEATARLSKRWPASGAESYTPTRSSRR